MAETGGSGISAPTDRGSAWTTMNQGLGSLNAHGLPITPSAVQSLCAATEQGVWEYTFGTAPNLQVTPSSWVFLADYNSAQVLARRVEVGGTSGLSWTATVSSSVGWLAVSPGSSQTPAIRTVSVEAPSSVTGTYAITRVLDEGQVWEAAPGLFRCGCTWGGSSVILRP